MESREIWDLYSEERELTGRDHIRGEEIPQGYYHLVVHVWIRNRKGKYLISQRSADRPMLPLKWECVGGSALKGEDSLKAALRETKEEVGIDLSPDGGRMVCSMVGRVVNGVRFSDIVDVWLFEYDGAVDLDKATTKEVAQTGWLDREEIKELYDRGDLVYTLGYFFEIDDFGEQNERDGMDLL
ncbi:MAG: NUDIX domain-containing protein [Lachnospiraceae bacterium]|nr:NUDIX domain-containing protein [Lachnospiraceae bacterium]